MLGGRGLSWQNGKTAEVGRGDCIVYLPRRRAHAARTRTARRARVRPALLRRELAVPAARDVAGRQRAPSSRSPVRVDGAPPDSVRPRGRARAARAARAAGPAAGARSSTSTRRRAPHRSSASRVARTRRDLATAAGAVSTGLKHYVVAPGKESAPPHCHSVEEEIFVILDGDGVLVLDDEETPVAAGHVIARPAGDRRLAHVPRRATAASHTSSTAPAWRATSATTHAPTRSRSAGSA